MGDNGRLRGSEKNKAFCCVADRLRVFPCVEPKSRGRPATPSSTQRQSACKMNKGLKKRLNFSAPLCVARSVFCVFLAVARSLFLECAKGRPWSEPKARCCG